MNFFAAGRRLTWVLIAVWVAFFIVGTLIDGTAGIRNPGGFAALVLGGALVIYGTSWAVGWIVRGAMGVESGKDH